MGPIGVNSPGNAMLTSRNHGGWLRWGRKENLLYRQQDFGGRAESPVSPSANTSCVIRTDDFYDEDRGKQNRGLDGRRRPGYSGKYERQWHTGVHSEEIGQEKRR